MDIRIVARAAPYAAAAWGLIAGVAWLILKFT